MSPKIAWLRRVVSALLAIAALAGGAVGAAAAMGVVAGGTRPGARATGADRDCTGNYAPRTVRPPRPVRFGVDPGLAGSIGGVQSRSVPDDPRRDLAALRRLRPPAGPFVLRLNRLFWADGTAGIRRFRRIASRYARAGFDVELQVRYHPTTAEAGDLRAWERYVRHVVDVFGRNRRVVAMTITNEVNVTFSPNTSDGSYPRAQDALIRGIEAAHREALRRGYRWLRFGFTYAYRFGPAQDSAFFSYLKTHGGRRFQRALGFVGLDFYPGTIYPPEASPVDGYRDAFAQAAGTVRNCFDRKAGIGRGVPIWITENGVASGRLTERRQAAALRELVRAVHRYSRTLNVTDYRWFNLRDSNVPLPVAPPLTFAFDGLLRSDYSRKPAFDVYRRLVARYGIRRGHPRRSRRRRMAT